MKTLGTESIPQPDSELQRMRRYADEWDRLLRHDPGPAKVSDVIEDMRVNHLMIGNRPLCPVLRPHFVTPKQFEADRHASETVLSALLKVARRLRGDPTQARLYLGPYLDANAPLFELDAGYSQECVFGRFDGYRTAQGLRFFEYNQGMAIGFVPSDQMAIWFAGLPVALRFGERHRLDPLLMSDAFSRAVLSAYRDWGGQGMPRTALALPPSLLENPIYRTLILQGLSLMKRTGFDPVVADPAELEFDGTRLRHGSEPVDLVLRVFFTEETLGGSMKGLIEALRARAVCMVSRFSFNGHKAVFDPLTDPRFDCEMTDDEREAVRRHVPWTRLVWDTRTTGPDGDDVDLIGFSARNRERLVLKSVGGYGGKEVSLGWRTPASDWESKIAAAAQDRGWVVQERIDAPVESYPLLKDGFESAPFRSDCSPTLMDGRMVGYLIRLSSSEITNVSSGGGAIPAFVVDEAPGPRGDR